MDSTPVTTAPITIDSVAPAKIAMKGTAKLNPAKKRGKGSVTYSSNSSWDKQYNAMKIEMDKQGVYTRAEIRPSFPGGDAALAKFIQNNVVGLPPEGRFG